MIITAWNMLTNGDFYREPGADYYTVAQTREDQSPRGQTARSTRLHRHPQTARRDRITSSLRSISGHPLGSPNFRVSAGQGR